MLSKVPSHHRRLVPLLLIVVAGLLVTLAVLAGGRSLAATRIHKATVLHMLIPSVIRRAVVGVMFRWYAL